MPSDGLRAVNAYVIAGKGSLTVIDPGVDVEPARVALDSALAYLGAGVPDITCILVTHFHYDHYSLAAALHESLGTTVAIGACEGPSLQALQVAKAPFARQVQQLKAYGAADLAVRVGQLPSDGRINRLIAKSPSLWLVDEQVVSTGEDQLRAIHTPGHTRGHMVFRDEARHLLFAGDHILPSITPSIGFEPSAQQRPLENYLMSLHRIRTLSESTLLPAHGAVTDSVHRRVDELLAHHEVRLAHAASAITNGAATALEAAARLRWTSRARTLSSLDVFNQMLAVLETGFHLDLLHERGDLERTSISGVWHFASNQH